MSTDAPLNPYEAPRSSLVEEPATTEPLRREREEHLSIEAGIYAFGVLDIIGGALTGLVSVGSLALSFATPVSFHMGSILATNSFLSLLIAYTGVSLLRLRVHARALQAVVFVLLAYGTLMVDVLGGTLLTALWAVVFVLTFLSAKARVVFSSRYRDVVIPASPQFSMALPVVIRVALLGIAVLGPMVLLYQMFEPRFR